VWQSAVGATQLEVKTACPVVPLALRHVVSSVMVSSTPGRDSCCSATPVLAAAVTVSGRARPSSIQHSTSMWWLLR